MRHAGRAYFEMHNDRIGLGAAMVVALLALAGCAPGASDDEEDLTRDSAAGGAGGEADGSGSGGGTFAPGGFGGLANAGGRGGAPTPDAGSMGADAAPGGRGGSAGQGGAAAAPGPQGEQGCPSANVPQEGLMLWLSAESGVTAMGEGISGWSDKILPARAATQGSAALRPVLVRQALNGRPAVRFDGSKTMTVANMDPNGLTGMTIVMVNATRRLWLSDASEWCGRASEAGCSNTYNSPFHWEETGSFGMVYLSPLQTQVVFRFGVGASGSNGEYKPTHKRATPIGDRWSVTIAIHDGAVNRLYVNGAQVAATLNDGSSHMSIPSPAGRTAIANTRDVVTLGSGRGGNGWQGDLAEILVYRRALGEEHRRAVEQHIRCLYGSL